MKMLMPHVEPLLVGVCEWCGKECDEEDTACCISCEAQLARLEANQGRKVLRLLKKWRLKPNHDNRNAAVSEVSALVDKFNRIDRVRREEAGAARRRAEEEAAAKEKKE